ncbi:LysR family transcriptional regulator [Paraburkholderia sp. Ac-20342]|uniref:LysR substrate-binding domain-containing protein n=1 Tax=unclassified Paraburkholderia TaxID=2615204 RepID=UPI00141F4E11|nr:MULTISPECIES: LysR substrate-binding domain-containing protein [unclassified Paraburkholderia]MBN3846385.1 LysR family transcriptional regulator [Paraburkholderia sp. Ac-20342]NIF78637.1 LysR family transcriptional regulator [Paraburkholderia sp. Cy-641]
MYDLIHLKTFVVLAEELHFRRAAERLHITQPPLSQRLKQLEDFLDVRLLERTTRSVELTNAGKVFLEGAREVLRRLETLDLQTKLASTGNAGKLRIGFVPSAAYIFLPMVLQKYKALHPMVDIQLDEMPYLRILDQLKNQNIDVALLRTSTQEKAVSNIVAMREPLIVAIPRSHRLAKSKVVRVTDLHQEPFIAFSGRDSPYFSEKIGNILLQHRVQPRIVQYSLLPTILSFVEAGIGLAIVPESVSRIANPNAVYKKLLGLQDRDAVDLTAAWRRDHKSILLANFIEIIREVSLVSRRRKPGGKEVF